MNSPKRNVRPWVVMGSIGLISAACLGTTMVLMGSFLVPLSQSLHTSVAFLSYYYTVLVLVMAVMMPVVPKILVRVNNRLLYTLASAAVVVSLLLIPHFTQVGWFFAIALVIGVAISFMSFVPVGILLGNWFVEKTGTAVGICWAITSVFQGIMSPILSAAIGRVGWQPTMTWLALLVAVLSIPCAIFGVSFAPAQEHRQPYGSVTAKVESVPAEPEANVSSRQLFTAPVFWLLLFTIVLLQFPAVLNQMFPTYAATSGFAGTVGGLLVTAAMVFAMFVTAGRGRPCGRGGGE